MMTFPTGVGQLGDRYCEELHHAHRFMWRWISIHPSSNLKQEIHFVHRASRRSSWLWWFFLVFLVVLYEVIVFVWFSFVTWWCLILQPYFSDFDLAEICVDLRGHVSIDGDVALAPGAILQRDEDAGVGISACTTHCFNLSSG